MQRYRRIRDEKCSSETARTHESIIKALLDHGAQVDLQNEDGLTPLIHASLHGHTETVKVLLDHGAQVDLQDKDGASALISASNYGHTETIKTLLDHGAQVDLQMKDGWSALTCASIAGRTETVQVLLDHGANANLENDFGKTSLEIATAQARELNRIVELLLTHRSCTSASSGATEHNKPVKLPRRRHSETSPFKDIQQYSSKIEEITESRTKSTEKEKEKSKKGTKKNEKEKKAKGRISVHERARNYEMELNWGQQNEQGGTKTRARPAPSRPTIYAVVIELLALATQWQDIGTSLEIDPVKMDAIKRVHHKAENCLREMLTEWLKTRPSTWKELAKAIEPLDQNKALEIRHKYCTRRPP